MVAALNRGHYWGKNLKLVEWCPFIPQLELFFKDFAPCEGEIGYPHTYHLGHYSARAFSLFPSNVEMLNLSPAERTLTFLMRRDLGALRSSLLELSGDGGFDNYLATNLAQSEENTDFDEAISQSLNTLYHQAIAVFDYALDAPSVDHIEMALSLSLLFTVQVERRGTMWIPFATATSLLQLPRN